MNMETTLLHIVLLGVVSYLIGGIPTAYLLARTRRINIFEVGSGNMGATNISRSMGLGWGLLVMSLDMIKGAAAIVICRMLLPHDQTTATVVAAITVIAGHNWSLIITVLTGTLRGGKGAATAFGTLLMIAPYQVIIAPLIIGIVLVWRTRYVSLAVLATFALALAWLNVLIFQRQMELEFLYYSFGLTALLLVRFKGNIQRLLDGTERRLGERA
jgi:glycerol-3-phosphate acyltransferase PlsY